MRAQGEDIPNRQANADAHDGSGRGSRCEWLSEPGAGRGAICLLALGDLGLGISSFEALGPGDRLAGSILSPVLAPRLPSPEDPPAVCAKGTVSDSPRAVGLWSS